MIFERSLSVRHQYQITLNCSADIHSGECEEPHTDLQTWE